MRPRDRWSPPYAGFLICRKSLNKYKLNRLLILFLDSQRSRTLLCTPEIEAARSAEA